MKKKLCVFILSAIAVLCLAFGLSACSVKAKFKVSFVVDGQTIHTINTNGNEIITMPPDPQKDSYIFDGWYWDKDVWEKPFTANSLLDAPLSSNMNVYCKWRPEHEHAFTEKVIEDKYKVSGASCTEKAKYYYVCECGEIGTETFEYGELLPHTEETIIGKAATCTETGLTDGKKCSVCGEILQEQATIPVKEHTEKTITGKPATCTEDGLTEGKECSVCHTVLVEQEIIPAGHTPTDWIIDKNSTCTEKGSRHKECAECGITLITEEIPLAPHTETTIYGKTPTCTDSGLTNGRICSVCGTITAEQTIIPATGHKYDNGVCVSCGAEQAPATISEVKGGTINDLDIYMFVEHDVTEVNLLRIVTCSPKSTWKLYEDKRGQREIATKIASGENDELNYGNNVFYIVATSANGIDVNTYTLTIYRSYAITVQYYNGSELDRTDSVYTGHEYTADYAPEYRGYTFNCWLNGGETFTNDVLWDNLVLNADKTAHTYTVSFVTDGKAQVVESITATYDQEITLPASSKTGYTFNGWLDNDEISENTFVWNFIEDKEYTATWVANTDTLYTVKHIGQNITDDEFGVEFLTEELRGTSDSNVTPAVKSYAGFTSPEAEEITVAPDGSMILTYLYVRNSYTLTLCANNGTANTTQTVKYEDQILPSAERQGYTFGGWFTDANLTQSALYMPANDLLIYAWWQEEDKANDFTYTTQETVTVTGYIGTSATITIPSYIGGIAVTELSASAFKGNSTLTQVVVSNNVISIGENAFYGCSGLTSITIPNSVTCIDSSAFLRCSGLMSIEVASENSIYHNNGNCLIETSSKTLVLGCKNSTIPIDGSVTSIGSYAFYGCSGLTSITIPDSVTSIGSHAFQSCTGLTSITIGNSVKSIGSCAFYGCSGLISITIPDSVTSIGSDAFVGCSGLTSVTIGDSVTSIGSYAFSGCTGLTSVTIGDSVTSIDSYAFSGCISLVEIYNKSELTLIAGSSNYGYVAYYAKNIYSQESGSKLVTDVNGFVIYDEYMLVNYIGNQISITIPDIVTSIGNYAFGDCSSLTSITIPDSVTEIGNSAFYGCNSLESITIPDSVTSIGDSAFEGCSSLETVYWNATMCASADNATYPIFKSCSNLTKIFIGDNVTIIPSYAFFGCSNLTSVTIGDSVTSIGSNAFRGCSGLTSITIPNSVTSIGSYAFSGCRGLTSITIPNSVTSIGSYAFYGCSGLNSITIPSRVTFIDEYTFRDCTGLTSITISNGVTSIGSNAFQSCTGLTSITIPNSITSIGSNAFFGCTGLTSITIGNSVKSIGNGAFYGCSSLTSITIPDSVTSIGSGTFDDCTGLTSVTIGDSVTSIGNYAFYGCSELTSITIPSRVTSIGSLAFSGCSKLTKVTFKNTSGWKYSSLSSSTSGTSISPSSLSNTSTAATYLTSTYYNYYWMRY